MEILREIYAAHRAAKAWRRFSKEHFLSLLLRKAALGSMDDLVPFRDKDSIERFYVKKIKSCRFSPPIGIAHLG